MSFSEDLQAGKKIEEYILKRIQIKYPQAKIMEGYFKEYDIIIPETNTTIEVKSDVKSLHTGNFEEAVEFDGKPSALSTTTADWWVFYDSETEFWITPELIRHSVKGLELREFIGKGDTKSKKAYLCPKDYIKLNSEFVRPIEGSINEPSK